MSHGTNGGNGNGPSGSGGIDGILNGLNTLFGRLSELAEKGEQLQREGAFEQDGKEARFQYGVSIRTAANGRDVKVEPFGNVVRKNGAAPEDRSVEAAVTEVREPMTDIMEEDDHVSVVAEMPGVGVADVTVDVDGDVLVLEANTDEKRYRKELVLPRSFDGVTPVVTANNGVVEIRFDD
jgi:HSP20 family protein